jgi:hypothetical protein
MLSASTYFNTCIGGINMIYLYVKTHNVTGLKYFGKTTKEDPFKYKGSGKYWLRHLKKHGKDINTEIVGCFEGVKECIEAALEFSKVNNIVASNEWANLMEEKVIQGPVKGRSSGHHHSKETKRIMSEKKMGNTNGVGNKSSSGRKQSEESIKKRRESNKMIWAMKSKEEKQEHSKKTWALRRAKVGVLLH